MPASTPKRVLEYEAAQINEAWLPTIREQRPFVTGGIPSGKKSDALGVLTSPIYELP
jgi:hypothetical protein